MGYRTKRLHDFARGLRGSRELLERERWPRERLERHRHDRLRALAEHAREHSPFWRERLPSGRIRLHDLPVLSKNELLERFDDAVTDRRLRLAELLQHLGEVDSDVLYLGEYRPMATSGSSGRKTVFVYDRAGWSGICAMFLRRSAWVGMKPSIPRVRLAMIGGGAGTHMSRRGAQTLDVGVHRLLSLAATAPLGELVERLNAFQPNHLYAYPSTAGLIADEQLAGRLRLRLEGISTSSEQLTPGMRERIERAFGVAPRDFYATTEGVWGNECEAGAMHVFDDMCIVENVDEANRPVPAGEVGSRILVTNLFNRALPLIRFEVSDMISVDPEPCPCGRSLMRLSSLEGRAEDVLRLGGVAVHPIQFAVVTADPDVREFQIVQEGERLRLRVALRNGAAGAEERLGQSVRGRLAELGIAHPDVCVERVNELERTPAGKLQVVVAAR
jgi:phenylacetate-coenzyme A ligase PaaK-like adenylate-forming protein